MIALIIMQLQDLLEALDEIKYERRKEIFTRAFIKWIKENEKKIMKVEKKVEVEKMMDLQGPILQV